jgi:hypothetical protein
MLPLAAFFFLFFKNISVALKLNKEEISKKIIKNSF